MGGLSMQPWGKSQIILMKLPVPKMKGKKKVCITHLWRNERYEHARHKKGSREANPYIHAMMKVILEKKKFNFRKLKDNNKPSRKGYKLREHPQSLQVFKDVALFVGHKQQVQSLDGLVHIAHIFCLNICMLFSCSYQLGKSCKKALNSNTRHIHKLSRNQHCQKIKLCKNKH